MAAAPTPQVKSSRYEEQQELAEATAAHEQGERPSPESPHPADARRGGARGGFRSHRARPLEATRPERREGEHAQDQDPSSGHAQGVPDFPAPLPGYHHYTAEGGGAALPHQPLDVGPAEPYYSKGMAHGVPADVHHGGRPSPSPEDRAELAATRQIIEHELAAEPDPVPVFIVEPNSGNRPMLRASLISRTVPAPGADPMVLVNRDLHRKSVRLLNESGNPVRLTADLTLSGGALLPANMTSYLEIDTQDEICAYVPSGAGSTPLEAEGTVTSPGAGATIASIVAASLPAGLYSVTAELNLTGTLTQGTDNNNTEIANGVTPIVLPNEIAAGQQTFGPFIIAMTGTNALVLKTVAAGTSGSIYAGILIAVPYDPAGGNGPATVSVISQYEVAGGS